jgi:hypothetical protein
VTQYNQKEDEMRLNGSIGKIEALCSKEETRYNLRQLHLDVKTATLAATDGRAAIIVPVVVEDDETSGSVHPSALREYISAIKKEKKQRYQTKADHAKVTISCKEKVTVRNFDGVEFAYPRVNNAPDIASIIPRRTGPPTITLNAELLHRVQMALGSPFISLWIDMVDGVVPCGYKGHDGVGVIMPVRDLGTNTTAAGLTAFLPKKEEPVEVSTVEELATS